MITIEKIKIYDRYDGDIDGLERYRRDSEKKLIDSNDWSIINGIYQDIVFINKGLAAQTFINKAIANLKDSCDIDSFDLLTSRINNYSNFLIVARLLKQIKTYITKETETVWAGFEDADKFLEELNQDIEKLENCDYQTLEKVHIEFLPTCTYQELSMSNGWSEKYLELSTEFDETYTKMIERKTAPNNTLPKAGMKWWQKLFRN